MQEATPQKNKLNNQTSIESEKSLKNYSVLPPIHIKNKRSVLERVEV
jgi:hypothetical protein